VSSPIYYGLEGRVAELWLVNHTHVKRVPGRKTDVSDAEWLADVAAHGMLRPSYVPPPPIRELRELTRCRKTQIDARTREIQRLEKGASSRGEQAELGGVGNVVAVGSGDGDYTKLEQRSKALMVWSPGSHGPSSTSAVS
jgi:Transposase